MGALIRLHVIVEANETGARPCPDRPSGGARGGSSAAMVAAPEPRKGPTMTDLTKSQLNTILSSLDGKQRNPNTKDAALKAIAKHGERLGLSTDDILAAAGGLLDGRLSAEEWLSCLGDDTDKDAPEAADVAPTCDSDAAVADSARPTTRTVRPNTKQAAMIDLLRRPEGATVEQIAEATGWQNHTDSGSDRRRPQEEARPDHHHRTRAHASGPTRKAQGEATRSTVSSMRPDQLGRRSSPPGPQARRHRSMLMSLSLPPMPSANAPRPSGSAAQRRAPAGCAAWQSRRTRSRAINNALSPCRSRSSWAALRISLSSILDNELCLHSRNRWRHCNTPRLSES